MGGPPATVLSLLDGFELRVDGAPVAVARGPQRLLAFVAVNEGCARRDNVFATLWPESDRQRASGNLRSALYRLPRGVRDLVGAQRDSVRLDPVVRCDVAEFVGLARRLIEGAAPTETADLRALNHDLLPTWYDDWVLLERERLRQLRLHALESLSTMLCRCGRFGEAIDAAMLAVSAEPLRESARRCLIAAHRAEGNQSEAIRQFDQYQHLLADELRVEPSATLHQMAFDTYRDPW